MSYAGIIRESISNLTGTTRSVFLCILIECNHADNPNFIFNNKPCPLLRGEWVTSRKNIQDLTGLTEQQVKTSLKNLKNLTIVTTNNLTNHGSKITVVNIDLYLHKSDNITNHLTNDLTNGSPTGNQRVTINKNNNNNKNEKNEKNKQKKEDNFIIPDGIKKDVWEAFEEMRISIKKKLTPHAKNLIISKLKKINEETSQDPNEVLEQSIINSWTGVFPIKNNLSNNGGNYGQRNILILICLYGITTLIITY